MPLSPGSRLGPYEILSAIGAGGMGEVYRAKDPRLGRDVAIKVLSQNLTASAEVRQRFEREARTVSQLTHAHICAVYDVGREGDTEYLVMEYLEGETLATRLQKGPLPLEQTLRYGIEIAEALERAHRQGIVHRDLKPGNVMLTRSGVKLLDFGLAKAVAPQASNENVSSLPTEAPLTQEGSILGTFQYMAPEQIEGRAVDARSDIFAFGAVLYEMATGRRAFSGSTQASLISAIFRDEPQPISAVTPASPVALDRTIRTCLAKDPEERWQNAGDIRRELKWIAEGGSQPSAPAPAIPAPRRKTREPIAWAIAGLAVLGLIATTLLAGRNRARPTPAYRLAVLPPDGSISVGPFALSPDGRQVAFSAIAGDGRQSLYVRSLDALEARALPGTEGGIDPFWSPDGASLGFFAGPKMKRLDLAGGPPRDLADVSDPRGGTWGRGGNIVFSPDPGGALLRIPENGGAATPVTELDSKRKETSHRWPRFLPDGKQVLFLSRIPQGGESFSVEIDSLDSKQRSPLLDALTTAEYADGRLYFARGTTLLSQAFDPKSRRLSGQPVPVAEGIWLDRNVDGLAAFSVASGVVAYRRGGFARSQFTWLDRAGRMLGVLGQPGPWGRPALSPDGHRVAFEGSEPGLNVSNIYLMDAATGTASRFTFTPSNDSQAVWSPTGDRVAFDSDRRGPYDIYVKSVSGTDEPSALVVSPNWKYIESWSSDGRFIAYREVDPKTKGDLWILAMAAGAKPSPFLRTPADERDAAFSPDGRFLAYSSDESGRNEIYVQTFPASAAKWQVSNAGGASPRWRRDGKELYYVSPDQRMVAVAVAVSAGRLDAGTPKPLFSVRLVRSTGGGLGYDVSADGERFLVDVSADEATTSPITLIIGSTTALERRP